MEWGILRNGKLWGVVQNEELYINYESFLSKAIANDKIGCFYGAVGTVDVDGSGEVTYHDTFLYIDFSTGKTQTVTKRVIKKLLSGSEMYRAKYKEVKKDRTARNELLKEFILKDKADTDVAK